METQTESFVELKLTPKGRYYWTIKVVFDSKPYFNPIYVTGPLKKPEDIKPGDVIKLTTDSESMSVDHANKVCELIKKIDKQLRELFPNNTAELPGSSSSFKGFDD